MQEPFSLNGKFDGLKKSDLQPLLKQFGKNVFGNDRREGFLLIVWNILKEPMFLMLVIACSLYFILGESEEGFLMLAAMLFVTAISLYQEVKSTRALAALKLYTEAKIFVIRDGKKQEILSEDLLPGDMMILEEGNRIPADADITGANDLTVNESIMTGESVPVEKNEMRGFRHIFQGTTINSGQCYATVTATGNRTQLGKLGKAITTMSVPRTLLQEQIARFVKIMAVFGGLAFVLIWLINYINSKDVAQSLLLGLTLAMSAIPEEIPVAFSSFMALGASHMARLGIITRQPQTIENLGAVSVICLDKTGTITENSMLVKAIYDFELNQVMELTENMDLRNQGVLSYARLASEIEPFDSMEKAIVEAYHIHTGHKTDEHLQMIHEYPLNGKPPMMTHVYLLEGSQVVAGKGAPERILRICKLDDITISRMEKIMLEMTSSGYRILGVCSAINQTDTYPVNQDDFNWKFEGLVSLYDPPKKNAGDTFKKWYRAGIQIKLITGDYAETAMNIASQTGINDSGKYLTGEQVMRLSPEALKKSTKEINIYARMFPDAKLKIIEILKANHEIVAMTGDGVNDGPALKSAHIGIAMGNKGTELAKEAADLIITDDNLEKITDAIQQGRKIYSNLKKAIRYIVSIHIPIICTASIPLLLGWKFPNIFTPIHIIFLELIMGPTCSIFYEREPVEFNIMHNKPRHPGQNMFSGKELSISIIQGLVITLSLLLLYYYFMHGGYPAKYVRTIVFTTLITSNIFLTFVNRSFDEALTKTLHYKNTLAPYVLLISVIFLVSISCIKPVQGLFQLTHISTMHYIGCVATGFICTGWFELYKGFINTGKTFENFTRLSN